jgi:four helix bundle protein
VREQGPALKPELRDGHRGLDVYQRAFALALEIHKLSHSMPKEEQFVMSSQIRRASKGICANIAEGYAKRSFSPAEYRRFLIMAIGSSEEMRVWLEFCLALQYLNEENWRKMDDEYMQIAKMLHGIARSLNS